MNNEGKLPQSGQGTRHASPGSSESPKEVGSKEIHQDTSRLSYPRLKIRKES